MELSKGRIILISALVLVLVGAVVGIVLAAVLRPSPSAETTVSPQTTTTAKPSVPDGQRIDCYPEAEGGLDRPDKATCLSRGCEWDASSPTGVPPCFIPVNAASHGYRVTSQANTRLGLQVQLSRRGQGIFGGNIENIVLNVEYQDDHLLRFTLDDRDNANRFKVPINIQMSNVKASNPRYRFEVYQNDPFAFRVIRQSTQTVLFDTGIGGLSFADQYLSITTTLPSFNIYGIGENVHQSFRHDVNYRKWPLFARDQFPTHNMFLQEFNHYGVHPFYTCLENDGHSHGVLLLNLNAMDYQLLPNPALTYRTTGGILDFYMFLGPTPENVIQQYTEAVGRPYMPPYWSLGFQLCRYGYTNTSHIKQAVERTRKYDIPHDVQYADIDHMDERRDFTIDQKNFGDLPAYFDELRSGGMSTIIILDPTFQIKEDYEPYLKGKEADIYVKWPSNLIPPEDYAETNSTAMVGYVWPPGKVVFVDFHHPSATKVWTELTVNFRKNISFDGLWLDMNEPANFGTNEEKPWNWPENKPPWSLKCPKSEEPPYRTKAAYVYDDSNTNRKARLSDKTLCLSALHAQGTMTHYNLHNLYGHQQGVVGLSSVRAAVKEAEGVDKRSLQVIRSTAPGSGKYAGRWLGDNKSAWKDMKVSIIGSLEFNLFGIPYIGADVCGFGDNSSAQLCKRWMQLGAFYTYYRNHNQIGWRDQDPGAFGDDVGFASRDVVRTRYTLLPYLYTLFHHAHTRGSTVMRPVFHEFPRDSNTWGIEEQFLWGSALLISPILYENQEKLVYYLPQGQWYNWYTGEMTTETGGQHHNVTVNSDSRIQLHIRGGYILPCQDYANNTYFSRQKPFSLRVALRDDGKATGDLFWDDGDSTDTYENKNYFYALFTSEKNQLDMKIQHNTQSLNMEKMMLDNVVVMGVSFNPKYVYYNGSTHDEFSYSNETKVLNISGLTISMGSDFTIEWSGYRKPASDELERLNCYPEPNGNKMECELRNCTWNATMDTEGVPNCYIPSDTGYSLVNEMVTELGKQYNLTKVGMTSMFPNPINEISVSIEERGNDILRIKIFDPNKDRFEVPLAMNLKQSKGFSPKYSYEVRNNGDPDAIIIRRRSTNRIIFDTSIGGLIFNEQFLQIATRLPSTHVYGFGETVHKNFRHNFNYQTWPMFARDEGPWEGHKNLYGVHPFYTCVEGDEAYSHGVLLLNSNAMEIVMQPTPALTYRTTGGILDFYIFMGSNPEHVVQLYTEAIGRPFLPPYWSLGFQLSRYGYNSLDNLKAAVDRTVSAGIPLDVQYADIDSFEEQKDFTIDKINFAGLPDYVKELRSAGISFITILDPCFISNETDYRPYNVGKEMDVYVKWPSPDKVPPSQHRFNNNDTDVRGLVWPKGPVVFLDFFKTETHDVWKQLITEYYRDNLTFDGLWIDMNEPANFGTNDYKPWSWPVHDKPYWSLNCSESDLDDPPYKPVSIFGDRLSDKTICMISVHNNGTYSHYDVHNLYGWSQTEPTLSALRMATKKRGVVITRSTYPGGGRHGGHWLGDNNSVWPHIRDSIIGCLEFNLFGIPYVGADICGYFLNATKQMCQRWMQLGAFYTFARNHNGKGYIDQDPAIFGPEVASSSRQALEIRYTLLPYLYTLFHHANTKGKTVMRPLFHEYPKDKTALGIDEQLLWGPAFLISPALEKDQTEVRAYFPDDRWYDYRTGSEIERTGQFNILNAPLDYIPLHVRGGYILPTQQPANNTAFSRKNPFGLLVAIGEDDSAVGDLFWDDGDSIDTYENGDYFYALLKYERNKLTMTIQHNNSHVLEDAVLGSIRVFGVSTKPSYIYLDGVTSHAELSYTELNKALEISNLNIALKKDFTVEWRTSRLPTTDETERIDCSPDGSANEIECLRRGCVWGPSESAGVPSCFINKDTHGYEYMRSMSSANGTTHRFGKISAFSMFGGDLPEIAMDVEEWSDNILRFTLYDPYHQRYTVPIPLTKPSQTFAQKKYSFELKNDTGSPFSFRISRKSTGKVIWDTGIGGLTFADQFLQIATRLPSQYIYGFGENMHRSLKHEMDYQTWPMFARDQPPGESNNPNLYGMHEFYVCVEDDDGNSHGVFLLNSNAMEVLIHPTPAITYRSVGGILDFYVFLGDSPEDVVRSYTSVIGRPYLPPYWSLGFQLSRYGYDHLDNLKAAVLRTVNANIPLDVQYADIDSMDERKTFTWDPVNFKGFPEYVKEMKNVGIEFVIILDPCFIANETNYRPYELGREKDIYIKWPKNTRPSLLPSFNISDNGDNLLGYVWPKGPTVFPDFFKQEAKDVWTYLIVDYHKNVTFEGLWIDMNEPASFDTNKEKPFNWPEKDKPYWNLRCDKVPNKWDVPPYKPKTVWGEYLSDKTICMIAEQNDGKQRHYDVHNLYGWSQTQPTLDALRSATNKRGMVITRSTFPGSGKHSGHWTGDNTSRWPHLRLSVIGILEFNLFGIPYVGADICGFFNDVTPELCQRWMEFGAFYTFSRNHNGKGYMDQDPGLFGNVIAESSKRALEVRYTLLPYLYTLFYKAHTAGDTVLRPLHHEYPTDKISLTIDRQLLWGPALLISPVLEKGKMDLFAYFPPQSRWFDYYTGNEVREVGRYHLLDASFDHIPLHVRGGYILPTQQPANNTRYSRVNPFGLIVVPDTSNKSSGELFWDDGDSIDTVEGGQYAFLNFTYEQDKISMGVKQNHTSLDGLTMGDIRILGVTEKPTTVLADSSNHASFVYNMDTKEFRITNLTLSMNKPWTITWS